MAATLPLPRYGQSSLLKSFYALCKPKVTAMIVFTAVIGMLLATPGMVPLSLLLPAILGIGLVTGAAAAFNCLIEQQIDAKMLRTCGRPLPLGQVTGFQAGLFASAVGGVGLGTLYFWVNPLTMWLTLATFFGYAVIYTVFLKPATPMNIVIGGASGAMPPVLGWAAVTNTVPAEALILFLIVFAWTPPHFWALALYRREDYAKSGLPMLPVTHGEEFTRLHILLYTVMLMATSIMPFGYGMSGWAYLIPALLLGGRFLWFAWSLWRTYSDALARRMFKYSIVYLLSLFAALLLDHYASLMF